MKKTVLFSYWLINVAFMIALTIALIICAFNIGFEQKHQTPILLTLLFLLAKIILIPLRKRAAFKAVLSPSKKRRRPSPFDYGAASDEIFYNQINSAYSNTRRK